MTDDTLTPTTHAPPPGREVVRAPAPAPAPLALDPATAELDARLRFAEKMAQAGNLPPAYRRQPANLLLLDQFARDLGLSWTAALTGVHIVEGKPTASSAMIQALVRRAGHKLRVSDGKDGAGPTVTVEILRADDPDFPFRVTWGMAEAAAAGLANKDVWRKYPTAMLEARATTACARRACSDALFGVLYTPEELGAVVDEDGQPVEGPSVRPTPIQAQRPAAQPVQQQQRPAPQEPEPEVLDAEVLDAEPDAALAADTANAQERATKALGIGDEALLGKAVAWAGKAGLEGVDVAAVLTAEVRAALDLDPDGQVPLGVLLQAAQDFVASEREPINSSLARRGA